MNEHPEILLAEYVDDSLPADARTAVEAHLASCPRCREEVALARDARDALGALPQVPAPDGLTFAVRRLARRPASPRIGRWVAAGAAAAVLLAGGFVVIRGLATGQGDGVAGAPAGAPGLERPAGAESEAADEAVPGLAQRRPSVPTFSESGRDYDSAALAPLGRRLRDRARLALAAGLSPTATAFFREFDPAAFTPRIREAIECSLHEVPPEQLLVPFSIEAASFQGEPAYLAAFLQGPAPDQPYDRVVLWVVGLDSCSLRSLATQRL